MARLNTQTCSEKVDGVCVIEGIFGPGKDEMVEMIPGETAPKAGKSTLGGASCGGGVAVREGVRGRHEGTLLVFGGCAFLPFSLGPTGDCSCRH